MATPAPAPVPQARYVVKQVISGDQVLLYVYDRRGGLPTDLTVVFSNITAPKLGKLARKDIPESKDEPYAWEAREFLRRKLIGQDVLFQKDQQTTTTKTSFGVLVLPKDNENITETLVSEGFAKVRETGRASDERTRLLELQEKAKLAKKNIWDEDEAPKHVRELKGVPENLEQYVKEHSKTPMDLLIEYVLDGSRFRAVLLPDFYHVTIALTGIRCPPVKERENEILRQEERDEQELAKEAKMFVEMRILQQDVKVVLEGVNDANTGSLYGSILHPKGNISELLLKMGMAYCVDWSIGNLKSVPVSVLRQAEKEAKEQKRRRWKNYVVKPQLTGKEKEFQGTVVEIVSGDQLKIQAGNTVRKIFLSSIRPPREERKPEETGPPAKRTGGSRALYDVPWLFDAREFLRKKLIGKTVQVTVDYTQPANDKLPEKICCTVIANSVNVAEALVSKGLARVVRHGQNDDSRSAFYDNLKAAEDKAMKSAKGVHSKDQPVKRVTDVSSDGARARTFLPSLQRSGRVEAVVEFVTSGSRLRLYIPKESCLATFLLAGISCPRGARVTPPTSAAEPFSEEALAFTHSRVMQREVEIVVDSIDKAGNFIGWLWVDNVNISVALVKEGLASVHFSAEKTEHYRSLKTAEDEAKSQKLNIWKNYVEEDKPEEKADEDEKVTERKVDYQTVVVTEVTPELKFFAQSVDQGPKLEALMGQIRQEFQTNPPLPGAFTPKRGDLCAAKFSDDQWYRARVERVQAGKAHVLYIDYGNREVTSSVRCAPLPSAFTMDKPYANEFALAFVKFPPDAEDQTAAVKALQEDIQDAKLLLNVEYKIEKTVYASLAVPGAQTDVAKALIADGLLLVDVRRERRLQTLVSELKAVEQEARKDHRGVWQYGDITEDDAKEFGR